MELQKFELSVFISLINGSSVIDATKEAQKALLEYILGKEIKDKDWDKAVVKVTSYLKEKYTKIIEAAQLVADVILDLPRYNRLVDLYKKYHTVEPLVKKSQVKKEALA